MNADAVAALRERFERLVAEYELRATQREASPSWEFAAEDIRAALAAAPLPSEPETLDHAPGCDVFRIAESWEPYGEPRHCDCGFALWDAKRRGVYNWTPPEGAGKHQWTDAPADGLDVERLTRALWVVEFEAEEGPYEHASEANVIDVTDLAEAIAHEYAALALTQEPRSGDDR